MDRLLYVSSVCELSSDTPLEDDQELVHQLENICKLQSVLLPFPLFGLRTRAPRKSSQQAVNPVASSNNSSSAYSFQYSISYGGVGRSRAPSKKNVVLEIADGRFSFIEKKKIFFDLQLITSFIIRIYLLIRFKKYIYLIGHQLSGLELKNFLRYKSEKSTKIILV